MAEQIDTIGWSADKLELYAIAQAAGDDALAAQVAADTRAVLWQSMEVSDRQAPTGDRRREDAWRRLCNGKDQPLTITREQFDADYDADLRDVAVSRTDFAAKLARRLLMFPLAPQPGDTLEQHAAGLQAAYAGEILAALKEAAAILAPEVGNG